MELANIDSRIRNHLRIFLIIEGAIVLLLHIIGNLLEDGLGLGLFHLATLPVPVVLITVAIWSINYDRQLKYFEKAGFAVVLLLFYILLIWLANFLNLWGRDMSTQDLVEGMMNTLKWIGGGTMVLLAGILFFVRNHIDE